jgi:CRISPR-associated protein Cmr1
MDKYSIEVSVVTPMFIGGAAIANAEIRPPSIRGVLRFWFRAMAATILDYDWRKVKQAEAMVFGSTDNASPFAIRIHNIVRRSLSSPTFSRPVAYLGYGPIGYRRERGYVAQRDYYGPGSTFTIDMIFPYKCEDVIIKVLAASLWLWGQLGGLGARVRRGFGSVTVKLKDTMPGWPSAQPTNAFSLEDAVNQLNEGLDAVQDVFKELPPILKSAQTIVSAPPSPPPEFFVLDKDWAKLYIGDKTFGGWRKALETIGEALIDFRNRRDPDYSLVRKFINPRAPVRVPSAATVTRTSFGLPLNFYFRSERGAKASVTALSREEGFDRRASPLMIRVIPLKNGKCNVALLHSKAAFLPKGAELIIEAGGRSKRVPLPSKDLVETFLNDLFRNRIARIYGGIGNPIQVRLP